MSVTDQLVATGDGGDVDVSRRQRKSILQLEITKKRVPRKDLMHFSRQPQPQGALDGAVLDARAVVAAGADDQAADAHEVLPRRVGTPRTTC